MPIKDINIVVINNAWPPAGGAGVERAVSFVEAFTRRGWSTTVICSDTVSVTDGLRTSPTGVTVLTTGLLSGDGNGSDIHSKVEIFLSRIKDLDVDLVISSSPTLLTHTLAKSISIRKQCKWLADFRDWHFESVPKYRFLKRWKAKNFEANVMKDADLVTVISDFHTIEAKKFFSISSDKAYSIWNGFDIPSENRRQTIEPQEGDCDENRNGDRAEVRVLHMGSIYGKRRILRPLLFACFCQLVDKRRDIVFEFVGNMGRTGKLLCSLFKPFVRIERHDFVSSDVADKMICDADILLVIPGSFGKGVLTGKIFHYLSTDKPILAMCSYKGALSDLLSKVDGAEVFYRFEFIKFLSWKRNYLRSPKPVKYSRNQNRYTRVEQAEKLSELLIERLSTD